MWHEPGNGEHVRVIGGVVHQAVLIELGGIEAVQVVDACV